MSETLGNKQNLKSVGITPAMVSGAIWDLFMAKLTCKQRHRRRRKGGTVQGMGLDPKSHLSFERVMFVLNYCRNRAARGGIRAAVTLMLLESYFYTGLRAIELLGLELQDLPQFHGHTNFVRVPSEFAKGGKQRMLMVNHKIAVKWDVYINRFHKPALALINSNDQVKKRQGLATPLILNEHGKPMEYACVWGRLKTVAKNTGIDLRPHICRHTYGTELLRISGSIELVQDNLGHSNPATTRIYAKTINPIAEQHLQKLDFG